MKISEKHKKQVDALQELLQKTYDAEAGYKQVMTKAQNEPLKDWLQIKAKQRSAFANQLDEQIRNFNQEPLKKGSLLGDTHRTWIDLKTAISTNTDEAILEECVRGEEATVDEYSKQMNSGNFDPEVHNVIAYQREKVLSDLRTVRSLEEVVS